MINSGGGKSWHPASGVPISGVLFKTCHTTQLGFLVKIAESSERVVPKPVFLLIRTAVYPIRMRLQHLG